MKAPRILVIGAGISGLSALKSTLENDSKADIICYERSSVTCGVWNYSEEVIPDQITVCKCTTTNTSKEFFMFSDHLFPDDTPNYMNHTHVKKYLLAYSDKFGLNEKIVVNRKVLKVTFKEDDKSKYVVVSEDTITKEEFREIFDFIYVCNGKYSKAKNVDFPNQDKFKGKIIHSMVYKDHNEFKGQRVCIVGIGNTAVDIAADLSSNCEQVYMSQRNGTYIVNKYANKGWPSDTIPYRRYFQKLLKYMPSFIFDSYLHYKSNTYFDHKLYGILPKLPYSKVFTTLSDEFPNCVLTGKLKIHPLISEYTETGVRFVDGTEAQVDVVILATGYSISTPFLDTSIANYQNGELELYKTMMLPGIPNLAFIGYITPLWSIPPIVEMQTRFMTLAFKGNITIPSASDMQADIDEDVRYRHRIYTPSPRYCLQRSGFPYLELLASDVGCLPPTTSPTLWLKDPRLAYKLWFGVLSASQYRLRGPNAWRGARAAILDLWRRVDAPYGEAAAEHRAKLAKENEDKLAMVVVLLVGLLAMFMGYVCVF